MTTRLTTNIGSVSGDDIFIRGHNLLNLLGTHDFTEILYLVLVGSMPDSNAKRMMNILLVSAVDHGMTPGSTAARLTLLGAPEGMQGALAAGLLGAGSRYVGAIELAATLLGRTIAERPDWTSDEIEEAAKRIATDHRARKKSIPGVGHPFHKSIDPRTARMLDVARECGFFSKHCMLAMALSTQASSAFGRPLPLNAQGAKAGIVLDMGLTPAFAKAVTLVGRCGGLLAHLLEEQEQPMGGALWELVREASEPEKD
jgi:citrate synthase